MIKINIYTVFIYIFLFIFKFDTIKSKNIYEHHKKYVTEEISTFLCAHDIFYLNLHVEITNFEIISHFIGVLKYLQYACILLFLFIFNLTLLNPQKNICRIVFYIYTHIFMILKKIWEKKTRKNGNLVYVWDVVAMDPLIHLWHVV